MVRRSKVEFTEGTYKTLRSAIVKTGDKNLNELWKEQVKQETSPVLHYTIIKEYLFGILNDLESYHSDIDINMVLKNCRKYGYHQKHYEDIIRKGVSTKDFNKLTGDQCEVIFKTKEKIKDITLSNGFVFIETEAPKDLSKIILRE